MRGKTTMEAATAVLNKDDKFRDSKGRLYFYDNAKFILIFFVVLAHFLSPFKAENGNEHIYVIWKLINTLHMPCLIFISGFFAKRYIQPGGGLKVQRTFSYFMLYLAAQIAITLFEIFALDNSVRFSILSARSSLWFLQCLGIWYLVLPFFEKFKPVVLLISAVVVGLVIGYDNSAFNILAISRVFVHFPFFFAGYFCTPKLIEKLFTKTARIIAVVFIAISVVVFALWSKYLPDGIITCNYPYSEIAALEDFPVYLSWVFRASFYLFAFGLGASFLAIVPRRKTVFTLFGSRTLQVYILHRFLYMPWTELGWWETFSTAAYGKTIVAVASLALTIVLSLKPFSYPFTALQNIKIGALLDKAKIKR